MPLGGYRGAGWWMVDNAEATLSGSAFQILAAAAAPGKLVSRQTIALFLFVIRIGKSN